MNCIAAAEVEDAMSSSPSGEPTTPQPRTLTDAWRRLSHAEVDHVLSAAGIPHLFIKGPTVADWLYQPGQRPFADVDVLVPPHQLTEAVDALAARGYADKHAGVAPGEKAPHSRTLRRVDGTGSELDVHDRFPGIGVDSATAWDVLERRSTCVTVAHRRLPAPDAASRLVLLTLHAGRDGRRSPKAREDVRRAIEQRPMAEWYDAVNVARELDALLAMRAGLSVVDEGTALADRLGLPRELPPAWLLSSRSASTSTRQLARILEAPWRDRLRMFAREVVPTPAFMRLDWPEARTGRMGLAAAYARRLARLARRFPSDVAQVRAARRASRYF